MRLRILISLCLILSFWNAQAKAEDIHVTCKNHECHALVGNSEYRCSVGKNGIKLDKIEGDGATPIGQFPLRKVFYRADKIDSALLKTILPIDKLTVNDGWCDDPTDPHYNQFVDLSNFDLKVSHEELYRDDDLYDISVVVGYNDQPVVAGRGSAIFIHVAKESYTGTAGCVAFSKQDLIKIISKLDKNSKLIVK